VVGEQSKQIAQNSVKGVKTSTANLTLIAVTMVFSTGYLIWLCLEIALAQTLDTKRLLMGAW